MSREGEQQAGEFESSKQRSEQEEDKQVELREGK